MREHKRDKERLAHILEAIRVIENGLANYPKEELLSNQSYAGHLCTQAAY